MVYKRSRGRNQFFEINNVLTTLKIIVVGIPIAIGAYLIGLITEAMAMTGNVLMLLWFVITLFLWGYLAGRFWGWK